MGNRAVITTEERDMAVYLHWNGGRDSVEAFLAYCKLRGFRSPEADSYGWARLAQVVCNFFGAEGLSVGILPYSKDMKPTWDNGDYIIKNWEIIERAYPWENFEEQQEYNLADMLHAIDEAQPTAQQLGAFLDAQVIPVSEVEKGDQVYMRQVDGTYATYEVIGHGVYPGNFGKGEILPYVGMYCNNGRFDTNPNNFIREARVRIVPRNTKAIA